MGSWLIEINFRNGAPGYALTNVGVNLPYLWYLGAGGLSIDNAKKEIDKDFYLMMELRDIRHVLNGDVKIITWIKDLIRTKSFCLNLRIWDRYYLVFKNLTFLE